MIKVSYKIDNILLETEVSTTSEERILRSALRLLKSAIDDERKKYDLEEKELILRACVKVITQWSEAEQAFKEIEKLKNKLDNVYTTGS